MSKAKSSRLVLPAFKQATAMTLPPVFRGPRKCISVILSYRHNWRKYTLKMQFIKEALHQSGFSQKFNYRVVNDFSII